MKLFLKDNKIIVFLNSKEILFLKSNDKENLEKYFKNLFKKIKQLYNLDFNGYYNIDVYKNIFGIVLEIVDEENEYYSYFNQIDMKINIINTMFLYEINYDFIDNNLLNKVICYKNGDKIYLKTKNNIDEISLSRLFEYGNIIYGDEVNKILKHGKKVVI